MKTYLVTRHKAAAEWIATHGIHIDAVMSHLEDERLVSGDTVIGTLPIHLVATLCKNGIKYIHLSLDTPPELRGTELTVEQMNAANARLDRYIAYHVDEPSIDR